MKIEYDWPNETDGLLAWFYCGWNFTRAVDGKRERGFRFFGLCFIWEVKP